MGFNSGFKGLIIEFRNKQQISLQAQYQFM